MSFSKQIRAMDTDNVPKALQTLLRQINLIQTESERTHAELLKRLEAVETRLNAAEENRQ